jgi:hypothetical protein
MANEVRKTSLGMQAVGVPPIVPDDIVGERPARRAADGRAHVLGFGVTVGVHAAVAALVFLMNAVEQAKPPRPEEPYEAIEAGLAIKKKSTQAPKSKMPQKDQPQVKPPEQMGVARNPDVVPPPEEKKPKKPDVDAQSVFDKYRRMDTKSTDEEEVEGADDGSEYGTLERAKGDPYIGELIGRMTKEFVVPSVVSDTSLKTFGCVKLDEQGRIQDRALDPDHKSRSHAFNSAVERRLQETTDMDKPVPDKLKKMLVGKFVCATYTSNRE